MDFMTTLKIDRYNDAILNLLEKRLNTLENELQQIVTNEPENTVTALNLSAKCAEIAQMECEIIKFHREYRKTI